jgi:hypothetical protein
MHRSPAMWMELIQSVEDLSGSRNLSLSNKGKTFLAFNHKLKPYLILGVHTVDLCIGMTSALLGLKFLTLFNAGFLCFYNILVHPEDSKTCLSS